MSSPPETMPRQSGIAVRPHAASQGVRTVRCAQSALQTSVNREKGPTLQEESAEDLLCGETI
jgi:hypothetical protein